MRTRWPGIYAAILISGLPGLAVAADAPHDATFNDSRCNNCHNLFQKSASGMADYTPGCIDCHNNRVTNPVYGFGAPSFGFPWPDTDQAVPGVKGSSHSWSGLANNPAHGATEPSPYGMYTELLDGKLQCSVCHDPHHAAQGADPSSLHVSIKGATAKSGGTGSATMTVVAPGTTPKGYRLQVQTATDGAGGTFVISHDAGLGLSATWLNWVGGVWVAGTSTGPGKPYSIGAAVALDMPGTTVSWTDLADPGDYWSFYVSYPFLRLTNVDDAICISCHRERVMGFETAHGEDPSYLPDGKRMFSHPVGMGLNANGKGTDQPVILGTDGRPQGDAGSTDLASNRLVLDDGVVRCTTCHAIHNADSNSLTEDAR